MNFMYVGNINIKSLANMSKSKFQTVYGVRIYPIEYLKNEELTESDLNWLFDKGSNSLIYSIIIGMFRAIGNGKRNYQIIKMVKSDDKWFEKFTWSKKQFEKYEDDITLVIKNLYQYSLGESRIAAQNIMSNYSITVK